MWALLCVRLSSSVSSIGFLISRRSVWKGSRRSEAVIQGGVPHEGAGSQSVSEARSDFNLWALPQRTE